MHKEHELRRCLLFLSKLRMRMTELEGLGLSTFESQHLQNAVSHWELIKTNLTLILKSRELAQGQEKKQEQARKMSYRK